jgi:hypothetical protein
MCWHQPRCPEWPAPDHLAARIVADQPGQGWSLLCSGVIVSDDGANCSPMAVPSSPATADGPTL